MVFLFVIAFLVIVNIPNKTKSEDNSGIPTVFVHGYKGTANSFGTMLERFTENGWGKKKLMYYVSSNGKVHDYYSKGDTSNPFIQIILQNNRASFADSTEWLATALRHLKKNYGVDTVNLVGHSMGGIISTKYTIEYNDSAYPNVNKLIVIGSPFDGIYSEEYFQVHHDPAATDLKPKSLALRLFKESRFPNHISVLSIGSTGDAIAFPDSVNAVNKVIPARQLKKIMIENEGLGHSTLHESVDVDSMIHSFLWQDGTQ
ncbi:alpha/beta fold hydrolase [Oceanobacillus bengalensis]|uniref:Alpha/beta fold hydrolase n=2 Tax=Oceanobacillus bengalensis TaxID=1435466 RepID=A0A494Z4K5_9BACI|nr:alpha/beta fold hydrolase [Oceanobacillus bengalensis]